MKNEPANNNFDIQRYLEGHKKFQFKPEQNNDYFLPALACCIELFGASSSLRTMVKRAEKLQKVWAGISNSSLNNLARQGVGRKTAEKLFRFLFSLNPKMLKRLNSLYDTKDTIYAGDNYWPWLSFVSTQKAFEEKEESELSLCITFLASRSHLSKKLNNTCRAKGTIEKDPLKILPFYYHQANKHTQLNKEEVTALNEGILILLQKDNREVPREAIVAMVQFRLDFYFNLMATLEVGILKFWLKIDADIPNRVPDFYQNGLFCSIANIRNQSSPFNRFLDALKERFNPYVLKGSSPLSDYRLATFIPISKDDEQYITLHEAQKRQLRKWREESAYPSSDTLEKLVSRLLGYTDQVPIMAKSLATVGIACIAMDRLNKQLLNNDDIDSGLLSEVYDSYPRYWQYYHEQIWEKPAIVD